MIQATVDSPGPKRPHAWGYYYLTTILFAWATRLGVLLPHYYSLCLGYTPGGTITSLLFSLPGLHSWGYYYLTTILFAWAPTGGSHKGASFLHLRRGAGGSRGEGKGKRHVSEGPTLVAGEVVRKAVFRWTCPEGSRGLGPNVVRKRGP